MAFVELKKEEYPDELRDLIEKYNEYMKNVYRVNKFFVEKRMEVDSNILKSDDISLSTKILILKTVIGE